MFCLWVEDNGTLRWEKLVGQMPDETFVVYENESVGLHGETFYALALGQMQFASPLGTSTPMTWHDFERPELAVETLVALSRLTPEGVKLAFQTFDVWEDWDNEGKVTMLEAARAAAGVGLTLY